MVCVNDDADLELLDEEHEHPLKAYAVCAKILYCTSKIVCKKKGSDLPQKSASHKIFPTFITVPKSSSSSA